MKHKDWARSPPTTRNISELGISENKVRLALGTAPAWRLSDTSVKELCRRGDYGCFESFYFVSAGAGGAGVTFTVSIRMFQSLPWRVSIAPQ